MHHLPFVGLRDFEASFLRLLEKITNGCKIEINMTGTALSYSPGVLTGGVNMKHDCGTSRSIGYFLEGLICLLPFAKLSSNIELSGITNDAGDRSVDLIRTVTLPVLSASFGLPVDGLALKVKKRGAPPNGGGSVEFTCPNVQKLNPVECIDLGQVRRVRGIAYCSRVSPQVCNRMRDSCKGMLHKYIKDVYIYTDYYKGAESGKSPGYALSLVAETTTGCLLGADKVAEPNGVPEDVGIQCAQLLFDEIVARGCIDTPTQTIFLLYMALTPSDASRVRLGKLNSYSINFIRLLKDFFGLVFKVEEDPESGVVTLSCSGTGFVNLARKVK